MTGINSSTALWYVSRATGIVALLLMTGVFVLGLLVSRNTRLPGLPKFAVTGLHRNLSLLSVVFVALHVLTAVLDGYVHVSVMSAVMPLSSSYERLQITLGTMSLDLALAVIITSLIRHRLSRGAWRAVHLLAYVSWPIAWLHGYTAAKDMQSGWLLALAVADLLVVGVVIGWRLLAAGRDLPRAERVGAIMNTVHHLGRGQVRSR